MLFENASFTLHHGNRVGVVGANGAGKSSLFALVLGELQPDAGELEVPQGWVMAHVAQEVPSSEQSAVDYVLDGDRELRALEAELAALGRDEDGLRFAQLHARYDGIGGYQARARAARLLNGLGFTAGDEHRPVNHFSGGWRMRLNLAQALMCRSDLLLLDEPTNHLDLDAVLWLQDWLRAYPGTLLLISHDRDFLDAVTDRIVHLENGSATLYSGNYSAFEMRRAEVLSQGQAAFERQQREIAHVRAFVDRFRAKATKARQAQSRLKALARMETIAKAHVDSPFDFRFRPCHKLPSPLLCLREASVGYGLNAILADVQLSLGPGDRVGLLGANGAGKSTLIKTLAGELPLISGTRIKAQEVRIGYFAQHQIEQLRIDESPLWHLQRLDNQTTDKELRSFLGGFGFQGDAALANVAPLSGGEKARLVLALLVYQRPNLLLLDEPTNHLDLEMRHALSLALQDFEGALVVVSHDRYLLRTVADEFWLAGDGRLARFEGDMDDYRRFLSEAKTRTADSQVARAPESCSRKDRRREEAEHRQRLRPLRQALQEAEAVLEKLDRERQRIEHALADPALYETDEKKKLLQSLFREKAALDRRMETAEAAWLEASEALETAQQTYAA